MYEVDLHFHTAVNSRCSNTSVKTARALYRLHKTPIVITDHRADVQWTPPFPHIFGREVHVPFPAALGTYKTTDIIVFGWTNPWHKVSDAENGCFHGTFDEFLEIYRQPHTILVAVHPTRNYDQLVQLPSDFDMLAQNVDAVEVFNGSDSEHHYVMNYDLALRNKSVMVAGSDDHYGFTYKKEFTLFEDPVNNVSDIITQVKQRKVKPYISLERYFLLREHSLIEQQEIPDVLF